MLSCCKWECLLFCFQRWHLTAILENLLDTVTYQNKCSCSDCICLNHSKNFILLICKRFWIFNGHSSLIIFFELSILFWNFIVVILFFFSCISIVTFICVIFFPHFFRLAYFSISKAEKVFFFFVINLYVQI